MVRLELAETALEGVPDEAGRLVYPELPHDVGAVGLGRLDAHAEQLRDLARPLSLGDELQHLALARTQRVRRQGGPAPVGVHHAPREDRTQVNTARGHVPDGPNEILRLVGLQDAASYPDLQRLQDELLVVPAGEEDDLGPGRRLEDLAAGVQAVEEGHDDIENGDVRP